MNKFKFKTNTEIDKNLIEKLEFMDDYESAYRVKEMKKEITNLKRKITLLKKQK